MSKFSTFYCSTALGFILSTTGAYADLTNEDVWNNWKLYFTGSGYTLNATESVSGDDLIVSDIKINIDMSPNAGEITMNLPDLTFSAQGDGSVKIMTAPTAEIASHFKTETGEDISFKIGYAIEGLDMLAKGEKDALDHIYSADQYSLTLKELTVDGLSMKDHVKATVSFANLSGLTRFADEGMNKYIQSLNVETLTYDVMFDDPEGEGKLDAQGEVRNLTSNATSKMPKPDEALDTNDMVAMLNAGFEMIGDFTFQGSNMNVKFDGPEGSGSAQSASEGGVITGSFGADGLDYKVKQKNTSVTAMLPNLPFPIAGDMAFSEFNIAMPIMKSDTYQTLAFGFTMGEFSISDMIWSMLDPTSQLSHDPATLSVDLTGQAKWLFDLFDPAQVETMESDVPAEIDRLDINKIELKAVGAHLTGNGAFAFDNSDPDSPQPSGTLDLKLVGGNGLLDNLIAMGWLSQENAMGPRMMMGILAVVGEGEDTMTSKLEFTKEGHILANGQRIQ